MGLKAGRAVALWALLAIPSWAGQASTETVHMVELVLKTPIEKLPPAAVDPFLAVDPISLPNRLRRRAEAKGIELRTLLQLSEGKKRGVVRTPAEKCEIPHQAKSGEIRTLFLAGYQEITEDEEHYLTAKTRCTERDMLCEFSLQIVDEPVRVGKKTSLRRRYFLYCHAACDPLMVLVGAYRARAKDPNTPFFGAGGPVCSR